MDKRPGNSHDSFDGKAIFWKKYLTGVYAENIIFEISRNYKELI